MLWLFVRPTTVYLLGFFLLQYSVLFTVFVDILLVMLHVSACCDVVSVPGSLVVTCWERADLLAVVCVVFSCVVSLSQMCFSPHQN